MRDLSHWTAAVHHDGSALYVSNPYPTLGETLHIKLRAPLDAPIKAIYLRSAPDGEPHHEAMQIVGQDSVSAFWGVDFKITMPQNGYRFKIMTDEGAYYLTALDISQTEKPDWFDFKLLADYQAPEWVKGSVFYQIFPDRFHNGDPANMPPLDGWTSRGYSIQHRAWDAPPLPWSEGGNLDYYGGDLPGIIQKLDYLTELGVNGLYLTPIFVSQSNHRYDILDFNTVDPYLGGDTALIKLRLALAERAMRLMLDVTPNHLSWNHPWFKAAQADLDSPTTEYFTFYDNDPQKYENWLGVPSLVKLNYAGQAIREIMYRAPDSILRRWLAAPYKIDGWRLDVLNMTARQGSLQLQDEVGREMRAAVKADNPDVYLLGEHFYDGTPHLQGDQLDATMNYQGFNIPTRRWLSGYDVAAEWGRPYADRALLSSAAYAEQMQYYLAAIPWVIALQQFNQLGSHDTMRILSALGEDTRLAKLSALLLLTFVGVPCLYYGDEIGLRGMGDPDNRRSMPWDQSVWDTDLLHYYQQLIGLRRQSSALSDGGYQLLYAEGDLLAFQRQSAKQRLIIVAYRGADELPSVNIPVWQAGLAENSMLVDLLSGISARVTDGAIVLTRLSCGAGFIFEER